VPNAWQENRFRARPVFSEKPALVDLHNEETQMPGLWFDELSVGQTFDHPIRRTVTETDNLLFTTLSHNPAALHLDAEYMKDSEYGRILVNSCFTLSLMVGVSVGDTTLGTAIANLGWDEVRFPAPVFVGDTQRVVRRRHAACRDRGDRSA
jgi:acyl dehydratase